MGKELKVTLKRSCIGHPEKQRRTLVSLKLTKTHKTVRVKDSPEVRGMLNKVSHLVEVAETD